MSAVFAGGFAPRALQQKMKAKRRNQAFTVRIVGCIRNEIMEKRKTRAARCGLVLLLDSSQLLWRERIHLVENVYRLQHDAADNLQTFWTQLVDSILRRVPEDVVVAVHEIDEVGAWHASLHERNMIVANLVRARKKMGLIAQAFRRFTHDIFEPRRRIKI